MKTGNTRFLLAALCACAISSWASTAFADIVQWDIDSTQSKVKLSLPDTTTNLDGITLTVRIRNQSTASSGNLNWNIGSTAFMDGILNSKYREVNANSIEFQTNPIGQVVGLNSGNYRPNPASFDPLNTNDANHDGQFANNSQAPNVFAARAIAVVPAGTPENPVNLNLSPGYLGFHDLSYDLTSPSIPTTGSPASIQNFDSSNLTFGILHSLFDFDGALITIVGQPIADQHNETLDNALALNTLAGASTIENLGGLLRQLTIPLNLTVQILDLGDAGVLVATVTGTIVATAIVPEPSTFMMAGVGILGLAGAARRRLKRKTAA